MNAVEARDVSVRLDRAEVLHAATVSVPRGGWTAVIGPNGAGKTTLLRAIAGLVPHAGTVRIGDVPLRRLGNRARARRIAYTPQAPVLPPDMRVLDYVLLGRTAYLRYFETEGPGDHQVARRALATLELSDLAGRRLGTLSGGERQRVVLARALAQQPDVLLLDEPTTALDLGHQQRVLELVDELRAADGLTVLSTLHDLGLAAQYADALVLVDHGVIAAAGPPARVLTEDTLAAHFGARTRVTVGSDGRPSIHPVRPVRDA